MGKSSQQLSTSAATRLAASLLNENPGDLGNFMVIAWRRDGTPTASGTFCCPVVQLLALASIVATAQPAEGMPVTRYGHGLDCQLAENIQAEWPTDLAQP